MKKVNYKILIASLIIVYSVALIGSIFTSSNTNTSWYQSIKPSITPPNWVFPVVWNILFFLIALSLYFALIKSNKKQKKKIIIVFGINFFLNILWSVLFFTMKNPLFSFFELILLWFSILLIIFTTWKINKRSSYLLIPYLLWVSFAGVLNYLIAF
ncbi:MAG: tryptophan-rich sensory protein [Nanoarchaeota archaeon]